MKGLASLLVVGLASAVQDEDAALACREAGLSVYASNSSLYGQLRMSFSKMYQAWPLVVCEALAPEEEASLTVRELLKFRPPTQDQMHRATVKIQHFVAISRRKNLSFAVRCGGHSNAGLSSTVGLSTLDVRGMSIVEPKFDSMTVKVGAGATAGQAQFKTVNITTNSDTFGAALPVGQKPSVGMTGLTLGGGFGFLTRYAGLLCDRLVSLDAVLPSTGEIVHATADIHNEYHDLFWASCGGGGGNFAVVTEFEFNMVPVCGDLGGRGLEQYPCDVVMLHLFVPLDRPGLLSWYQEWSMRMDPRITPNFEVSCT